MHCDFLRQWRWRDCYIVSVGNYDETIDAGKLNDPKGGGLAALEKHLEPTMIVVPDAVLLSEADCFSLQAAIFLTVDLK